MNAQVNIDVGPKNVASAARSMLYRHFSRIVRYPESEDQWLATVGAHADMVAEAAGFLPYAVSLPAACDVVTPASDLKALQLTYTRLFEVAGNGGAIPLNESEYGHAPRQEIWEDTIRFYEFFGLHFDGALARNWPDHLGTQLECLHYLAFLQTGLGEVQTALLRAQSDFIERHLLNWLPRTVERVHAIPESEPYAGITATLLRFVETDLRHLRSVLESAAANGKEVVGAAARLDSSTGDL